MGIIIQSNGVRIIASSAYGDTAGHEKKQVSAIA